MACRWNLGKVLGEVPYEFRDCSGAEQVFQVDTPHDDFRTRLCWKHAFVWITCKNWKLHPIYELGGEVMDVVTGKVDSRSYRR